MYRASTPKQIFIFPTDIREYADEVLITYAQNGNIVFEKQKSDLEFVEQVGDDFKFAFYLTQEETNLFKPNLSVEVQVRIKTLGPNPKVIPSEIFRISVKDVLNDEVL